MLFYIIFIIIIYLLLYYLVYITFNMFNTNYDLVLLAKPHIWNSSVTRTSVVAAWEVDLKV